VLGASGYTGRLVVAECLRRGHRPVVIGRDADRVRAALTADGHDVDTEVAEVRAADVTDPGSLRPALDGIDLLLTTVGPFDQLGREVLDAAIETGSHYVDVTGEQSFVRWAFSERDVAAHEAGVVAVPAAGFEFAPGDLLADIAAGAVSWPSEVHVAYTLPSAGRFVRKASAGTRRSIAAQLGRTGVALVHSELVEELPGEARRLAWFPRPVGPRHAAGIPGGEAITVPRHVPGIQTVRTYFAMPTWKAELAQMGTNLTRWGPARRLLRAVLERGEHAPSEAVRAATRWGCVAEAEGEDGVARAWAYGHDVYGLAAVAMVAVAEAVLDDPPPPGVLPPAAVATPSDLLDRIAARSDLRWSVARPEPNAAR
jgi:short subunit dehydrogenase-like uncharacterized protein